MVKVALAGGWGQLGHEVLDALIARHKHDILILSRRDAPTPDLGRGVHTVLSFLAGPDHQGAASAQQDAQISLIDASVRAGVKRFAPSEWASAGFDHMPWYAFKQSARDHLSNLSKDKKATSLIPPSPSLFTNYLLHPFQSAKHVRVFEQQINFYARRALVADTECFVTSTAVRDVAKVVALAVEYEGEWPVDGGISGARMTIEEVIALGEKIRGTHTPSCGPLDVTELRMQDLEAGVVKAPWFPEIDHPAIPEETQDAVRPVLLAGVLRSLAAGAWESSDTWNRLLPDFEFTQPEDIFTKGWAAVDAGAESIPVEDY
ncbi:NmrA-like family protein [Colletotrichum musicola]|uniref:NmrA-like family protein n=1 Tax=Colletotrichum musicola TaxID=2175873 RepID=A0A8H6N1P5_9PEZI|nr:NmrA-like family protein [Colletotrichum musicola]